MVTPATPPPAAGTFGSLGAVAQAIGLIGTPSLIAIYLVYILGTRVTTVVAQSSANGIAVAKMTDSIGEIRKDLHAADEARTKQLDALIRLVRANCVAAASTPERAQSCREQ